MDQNIEIAVRIKPAPLNTFSPLCLWDSQSIQITDRNLFTFDSLIDPTATQDTVFQKVGLRIVSNILDGYNGCIFAYGQTGSGKTFTMTGDSQNEGLVQKCLKKLWNCVKNSDFFQIKLGYFEIYNQTIKDLLSNQENLTIREHAKTGFYVENLTEKVVDTFDQFEQLIKQGISVRTVKQTKANNTSSRSHSVLEVNLSYKKKDGALMALKHAKLTFIDLAGSEKQKQTQVEGQRLKQAANINKSLSSLSLVISKLSEQSQRKSGSAQMPVHIPFRNSVLTKILKNSLTGKSKVMIVCTVSLEERFIDETISTLRFAQMAKSIKIKVNKNEEQFDGTKQRLFEEFAQVKQKYFQMEDANKELKTENQELKRQNACLKDEVEKKEAEMTELQVSIQCMRLESKQMFQEMLVQSQMPQQNWAMSQSAQMQHSNNEQMYLPGNQASQSYNNYRRSQVQQSQMMRGGLQYQSSQSGTYFYNNQPQSIINFNQGNQYSQASIFTSNLSSSQSQRNSFCTIPEEDSKAEHSGSESKEKMTVENEAKIIALESLVDKLKVENEFLKFYRQLQEYEISELMKKNVFLSAKEEQIEQANGLFAELVKNQQFSHAQMKFLEACLKNCQKDKMALELAEQEKANQKVRFNQTVQKIKNLLLSYTKTQPLFDQSPVNQDFLNQEGSGWRMQSDKIEKSQSGGSNFFDKQPNNHVEQGKQMEIDGPFQWDVVTQKQSHKSDHKKRFTEEILPEVKASQTPMNSRQKVSQMQFVYPQTTQMFNQGPYQSASQIPMFMQDTRSMISQTSNRLSNNELEYLKKDYQKMSNEVKELKEEIERYKILMLEKESLVEEKGMEVQEAMGKLKLAEQDLQTQKELLEMERQRKEEMQRREENEGKILNSKVLEKEEEIKELRNYMSEIQRGHECQRNSMRLRHKELQLAVTSLTSQRDQYHSDCQAGVNQYEAKLSAMRLELDQIKKTKEELQIEYGVLNSENILLTQSYNYLKSCLKTNTNSRPPSPQKVHSKHSSFFSISQPQSSQNLLTNNPPHTQKASHIKPKQLSQQQCIQVVEEKSLQYMYQAAYYFYKKCFNLQDLIKSQEQNILQLQQQVKSSEQNHLGSSELQQIHFLEEKHRNQILQMDHALIDAKRSALAHQQAVVDLKKQILDLKQQLYHKDKLIDELTSNQKRTEEYSQLLETKLKEKNQKELEAKQKAHHLSAQLRDNSLTPASSEKNIRLNWGRKSFAYDESDDSLVSIGDTPINLAPSQSRRISTESRGSVEKVRGEKEIDEVQVLRCEIQELSHQQTSTNSVQQIHKDQQQKEGDVTESIASHTVTNANISQQQVLNQNPLNFLTTNHTYQGMFGKNRNRDRSKAASTKGHLQLYENANESSRTSNMFKSKK